MKQENGRISLRTCLAVKNRKPFNVDGVVRRHHEYLRSRHGGLFAIHIRQHSVLDPRREGDQS